MKRLRLGCAALATALAVLGGPAAVRAAGPEAGAPVEASSESWSQYFSRVEKELRDVGKSIDKLGKQAEAAGGKAKTEARKAVKELDAEKRKLDAEARQLKRQGEEAWRKLRSGVDSGLRNLKHAVDKTRSTFESTRGEPQ